MIPYTKERTTFLDPLRSSLKYMLLGAVIICSRSWFAGPSLEVMLPLISLVRGFMMWGSLLYRGGGSKRIAVLRFQWAFLFTSPAGLHTTTQEQELGQILTELLFLLLLSYRSDALRFVSVVLWQTAYSTRIFTVVLLKWNGLVSCLMSESSVN